MTLKWIGAILVIVSCGGFGFMMAASCRREEKILSQLIHILEFMECELEYRMTPLPQLCRKITDHASGCLRRVFTALAVELESQIAPDAGCCMEVVLARAVDMPRSLRSELATLGTSLGRFDLSGQLKEITAVRKHCEAQLEVLRSHKDNRTRSYQTLGLCAGAALAILFI